eukprot:12891903-Prorocentrum_lima.AAC.1
MESQEALGQQADLPAASQENQGVVREEPRVSEIPTHKSLSQRMAVMRGQVGEALTRNNDEQGRSLDLQESIEAICRERGI